MAEAQQTAAPLASQLGKQVEIVPGPAVAQRRLVQRQPESMANSTYMMAPTQWLSGDVGNSIPGSISARTSITSSPAAIRKIYDSGHNKPVVFSQGTAIMVWTLMNAKNPRPAC